MQRILVHISLQRFQIIRIHHSENKMLKSVQSTLSHLITTSVPRAMFTHFLVEHGLSQYYIHIEWIYLGVELHNLMNISNPLTFRVKTFQLSLSMKSPLNVNSSGLKRFDSERKIFQDIYSKCLIITDNTLQSRSCL